MPHSTVDRSGRPPRILYVEDNVANRMLVRAVLEAEGYTVMDAEDGLAGIEAAVREKPSLILLDINLPGVDGYEVVALLRTFPDLATVPVVALTAHAMEGDRQRTLVAGCDGYLAKPIDVDAFPRQVREFLEGKRERIEDREAGNYLRDLNQRLVSRLLTQVEELRRLNAHFANRATQLEQVHQAVHTITSDLGAGPLLERLLPDLGRALGTTSLVVELTAPPGLRVATCAERPPAAREDWRDTETRLPLEVPGHSLGVMIARHVLPPGGRADQENLLKLVASQVATLVENSHLYEGVTRRAAEHESLVEAGRLLASTLEVGQVLQRLTELVQRRLQVDVVRIWLRDRSPDAGADVNPVEEIVGWIMNHRAPLVLPDLASDARVRDRSWVSAEGLISFLGVPLLLEGEPVGVMLALSRQPRAFTAGEVSLAEALATSAAAAIRNARLYEETQHRLRQTELLVEVGRAVGSTLDPGEVARRATEEMVKALGADFGAAWRIADGSRLTFLAGHRVPDDLAGACADAAAALRDRVLREALDLGAPVYAADSQADPRFHHPLLRNVAHKSLLVFPMLLKGQVVGGFALAWVWDRHRFVPDDLRLAEGIAHQAAMAIENSQLYGELREALRTLEDSQKQIVRTERLRALGEMAGGVAHDFNNLLAIIVGRAELLLARTKEEEAQKQLNLIIQVGVDAARTVKRIQEFTRMRKARPFQPINLTLLAEETIEMTRSRWKNEAEAKGIRYEIAVETSPVPAVAGDPSEIREALTNIVFNALDVMPEGGRLTLRTGVENDRVFCTVADTGSGMTDEVKQRVFDPFFTTKGERGTGLGLSVVYGIVNRHGGDIEVQSRVGHGSVFTVRLPVSHDAAEAPVARPVVACQRRGKILVIDDEPYVCGVLKDLLCGDGHEVITCEDGESGLTRFEAEPFDMVITDFGMPRMSGWDVARFVKIQQPQMPVAMVTGWSDRFDPAEIATRGVDFVVAKPFKLEDIRAVVASALNRSLV